MNSRSDACESYAKEHPFCEICGQGLIHIHHIRTRGAGGDDSPENLLSLCPIHHTHIHIYGAYGFAGMYGVEKIEHALRRSRLLA